MRPVCASLPFSRETLDRGRALAVFTCPSQCFHHFSSDSVGLLARDDGPVDPHKRRWVMAITGNSADLSLVDLVQANVLVRNVCRITVAGPAGSGVLFLADGAVVHASYGGLEGREAFFALVGAGDFFFQVETGLKAPRRSIHEKWENLALEAMRLKDEGRLPLALAAPVRALKTAAAPPLAASPAAGTRITVLPQVTAASEPSSAPRPSRRPRTGQKVDHRRALLGGAAVLIVIAGASGYFAVALRSKPDAGAVPSNQESPPTPIEASELTQPGDARPVLLTGTPPASPLPDLAVRPTIVCRILIGTEGQVLEARVYQSRLDLAPFEETALAAVRTYRFRPASRNAAPVPVWVNWPVSFE